MLTYNFENPVSTLSRCKKNDLAVVETQGYESAVKQAICQYENGQVLENRAFETLYKGE